MTDMLQTIIPKSDQSNYDDFIGGISKTIKVTNVTIKTGEQPVTVHYEGDNGKPYKPCKSMCRVLVHVWGPDAKKYAGKSLTLYGDPNVVFGGAKVGGIRISHMSDITQPVTMMLTATKANRKPFTVQPLVVADTDDLKQRGIEAAKQGGAVLDAWLKALPADDKRKLATFGKEIRAIADGVDNEQKQQSIIAGNNSQDPEAP